MPTTKDLSARYFFLAFAAAFLVLSILFLFLMSTVHPNAPVRLEDLPLTQEAVTYLPVAEDCMTVLMIGADAARADTLLLARFDPVRGQVPLLVLPPETLVDNGGVQEQLSVVYAYGGADYTRSALARHLGIPIDRYVRMNESAFITAAGAVGSVEFDIPHEIPLEAGGMHLRLSPGMQLLDGAKEAAILGYRGYEEGEEARSRLVGEMAAAIVNQRIDVVQSALLDKIFETIVNVIDTDISYPDFDSRREAALFLARLGSEPAVVLPLSGRVDEAGGYVLSDTCIARVRREFITSSAPFADGQGS